MALIVFVFKVEVTMLIIIINCIFSHHYSLTLSSLFIGLSHIKYTAIKIIKNKFDVHKRNAKIFILSVYILQNCKVSLSDQKDSEIRKWRMQ